MGGLLKPMAASVNTWPGDAAALEGPHNGCCCSTFCIVGTIGGGGGGVGSFSGTRAGPASISAPADNEDGSSCAAFVAEAEVA